MNGKDLSGPRQSKPVYLSVSEWVTGQRHESVYIRIIRPIRVKDYGVGLDFTDD